jgi:hypothetical protein
LLEKHFGCPVFLVYGISFVFMQPILFKLPKASGIEVVKIIKRKAADTRTVLLNFKSGGEKIMATLDIQEGKIASGVDDADTLDIDD